MHLGDLQFTVRTQGDKHAKIAQSAVKRNAIYTVTAGSDLIGTVEG